MQNHGDGQWEQLKCGIQRYVDHGEALLATAEAGEVPALNDTAKTMLRSLLTLLHEQHRLIMEAEMQMPFESNRD